MPFNLSEVVPWGRSYAEYVAMFSMSASDLQARVLGCGDGPASFNRGLTMRGGSTVSVDPIYAFTVEEIKNRIDETYDLVLAETRKNREEFTWGSISTVEELGRIRRSAMAEFLEDFDKGRSEGRYLAGSLPRLIFQDDEFDLALCSHLLFLYSEQLSAEFHLDAIEELCRVAAEVRIFPLLELGAKRSRHLEPLLAKLNACHYRAEIRRVAYEFQRGGNEMLVVSRHDAKQDSGAEQSS